MIFNRDDYDKLSTLFDPELKYAGFKPGVFERPDGKGGVDYEKKYLHVALKYNPPEFAVNYLARAHFEACKVAESLKLGSVYPKVENGTLRVLEYPVGAGTEAHCDFDLFTINCYRETPEDCEEFVEVWRPMQRQMHMGEIGRLFDLGPATPHRVQGKPYIQRSIVYFASPSMDTSLLSEYKFPKTDHDPEVIVRTTGEWQMERVKRSRTYS